MDAESEQDADIVETESLYNQRPSEPHVIFLHEKLAKRKTDRYIINLALAYHKIGYKVTILTSQFNKHDCISDIQFTDKIDIQFSGWWIPRSFFGFFRNTMSILKACWMALRLACCSPQPFPELIVLDTDAVALYILNVLTNYRLFYYENFHKLKSTDACFEHSRLKPSLLEAKWLKLAEEIIVESVGFSNILKKSFPSITREPIVLYPSVDLGLWKDPGINIARIVPDLLENTVVFLSIGKYRRTANFMLAVESFENLLQLIDDRAVTKRFQLVIAGNCRSLEEKMYYNDLMTFVKEKLCASQITFLKQLPIVHEKTLIKESDIMIHPAKNEVSSYFILKAMSLGKPIVASNKGIASKLLVHRLSGVIIEPEPRLFAVALKKLMMSPHLQIFLGDMARDAFQKSFSFESFCEQLCRLMKRPVPSKSKHDIVA